MDFTNEQRKTIIEMEDALCSGDVAVFIEKIIEIDELLRKEEENECNL